MEAGGGGDGAVRLLGAMGQGRVELRPHGMAWQAGARCSCDPETRSTAQHTRRRDCGVPGTYNGVRTAPHGLPARTGTHHTPACRP